MTAVTVRPIDLLRFTKTGSHLIDWDETRNAIVRFVNASYPEATLSEKAMTSGALEQHLRKLGRKYGQRKLYAACLQKRNDLLAEAKAAASQEGTGDEDL